MAEKVQQYIHVYLLEEIVMLEEEIQKINQRINLLIKQRKEHMSKILRLKTVLAS
jgi:hypothetical protein